MRPGSVAEQLPAQSQLARLASDLEPYVGVKPQIPDVATLVRVLYCRLTPAIINDLDTYKIPALRQSGLKVVPEPRIILASNAGYSDS